MEKLKKHTLQIVIAPATPKALTFVLAITKYLRISL